MESKNFKNSSKITVRPYCNTSIPNMGLEKYDMVVFDGIYHEEPIVCLEVSGVRRYITGLNEFAPEIKNIQDIEEKEAKIKEIRQIVSQIDKELYGNVVDIKDEQFWDKIKGAHPTNYSFWEKIIMRYSNEPIYLDPINNVNDLIKIKAIEAGGFSMCGKSLEDVRTKGNKNIKFYLDKYEQTASIRTEVKKLRNKAGSDLQDLYENNVNKLMLVCKIIDSNSSQYKKSTPIDVMYNNMDMFINGETVDTDKRKTAKLFIDTCSLDMETLKLKALVKDGNFYRVIATKSDGHIYHLASNSLLGRNPSDVVEFLRNPLNEDVLKDLLKTVEKYWNE